MTGKRIGYIRVSTVDQNPERQLEGIELDKKFTEYASAKNTERPILKQLLEYVREDDLIFVHSIDRLARNSSDLCNLINYFTRRNVSVTFVKQNLHFDGKESPMAKFQLAILGAVAELEREINLERQREGIAIAKAKGKYKGGVRKMTPEKIQELKHQMETTRKNKTQIAKELGVCRFTLYRYLKDIECSSDNLKNKTSQSNQ